MELRILGPLEVLHAGRIIELGGPRHRLLVARLAVSANRVVPLDALLDELWRGDPPSGAKAALQAQISRVRKALGDPTRLKAKPPGYVLRLGPGEFDAARFEVLVARSRSAVRAGDLVTARQGLAEAEGCWRGPALAEFVDYPFAQAEATRLEELRLGAIEERIDADLSEGRHAEVVAELEGLVSAHQFRERLWAQWMLALYRTGRQTEALRACGRLRRRLGDELGIEPGEEVARLEEAILLHKPELAWVGPVSPARSRLAATTAPPATVRRATPARLRSLRLVGRRAEQAALLDAAAAARAGSPSVVVVAGEAGVGKTRLVAEVANEVAGAGAVVLAGGSANLAGGESAYAPLAEAFRRYLRSVDARAAEELIAASGGALARIVPELADDELPPISNPARLHGLLLRLLGRLADAVPVMVMLEDLHWADPSTTGVVEFLARNMSVERVLVVVTLRPEELQTGHPAHVPLWSLERHPSARWLDLAPLSADEAAELVEAILGGSSDPEFVERVVARADGIPLFVEELVAGGSLGVDLRPTLRQLLLARIDTLGEPSAACARLLAVSGRSLSHPLLARASGLSPGELFGALRQAVDRHVIVVDGDEYRFRHALVGEAVHAQLLPGERVRLHACLASALAAAPVEGSPAEVAHHWLAAGEWSDALSALITAAAVAEQALAYTAALAFYQQALEIWDRAPDATERAGMDRAGVLERAADVAVLTDRASYALGTSAYRRAISFAEEALDRVDATREPVRAGLLHARVGQYLWSAGRDGRAHSGLALRLVPESPPSIARAQALASYARGLMVGHNFEVAVPIAQQAIELAERLGDRTIELDARITLGSSVGSLGNLDAGTAELERALIEAEEVKSPDDVFRAVANLWCVYWSNNSLDQAFAVLERGDELAHCHGFEELWAPLRLSHTALHFFEAGRWEDCEAILVDQPKLASVPDCLVIRAALAAARGDAVGVTVASDQLEELTNNVGCQAAWMCEAEAELALWLERPHDARTAVHAGLERSQSLEPELASMLFLSGIRAEANAAEKARFAGRQDEARSALARAEVLFQGVQALRGDPQFTSVADAVLVTAEAELARLRREPEPRLWRLAVRKWEKVARPYPLAWVQWRAAESLYLAGESDEEAGALLAASRDTAKRLRLTPLLRRVDALVDQCGFASSPS